MNSSKVKGNVLGEPFGTASHKLKKAIMFALVVETGRNICFKCGLKIENLEQFSIEHKIPWQTSDDPKKYFYDIENIAFSHLKCNRPHKTDGNRYIAPSGMAWCKEHKTFLSIENFGISKNHWNGLNPRCKECNRKRVQEYRKIAG